MSSSFFVSFEGHLLSQLEEISCLLSLSRNAHRVDRFSSFLDRIRRLRWLCGHFSTLDGFASSIPQTLLQRQTHNFDGQTCGFSDVVLKIANSC